MPDDSFMQEVFITAAEQNAADIQEKYKCHICGEAHNEKEELMNCINHHMKNFLAGLPVKRDAETVKAQISHLPEHWQDEIKKDLKID